jgi:hypothetical protein
MCVGEIFVSRNADEGITESRITINRKTIWTLAAVIVLVPYSVSKKWNPSMLSVLTEAQSRVARSKRCHEHR